MSFRRRKKRKIKLAFFQTEICGKGKKKS
jgi:hypothetical protein